MFVSEVEFMLHKKQLNRVIKITEILDKKITAIKPKKIE